jgi:pimeloyl-ACP methyl ester carboxylesterase
LPHSLPYPLPWGRGSIGFFAERPADRLIVFVHGFGGSALKTWKGAESILEQDKVETSDVVFYGYGSLAAPARNSATLFRKFLEAAADGQAPWRSVIGRGGGVGPRDYKDILLIAHSLGAVVVRRAALDGIGVGDEWVSRTRLLLFGPAHMGTRLVKLSKMLRSGFGAILSDLFVFARVRTPVLDDLEEGSAFLQELQAESRAALQLGIGQPVRAEAVVFGERDDVVLTAPFCADPLSDVWADEDHCSVCRAPQTVYEIVRHL